MAITMVTTTMPLIDGSPLAGIREQRKRLLARMAALSLTGPTQTTRPRGAPSPASATRWTISSC